MFRIASLNDRVIMARGREYRLLDKEEGEELKTWLLINHVVLKGRVVIREAGNAYVFLLCLRKWLRASRLPLNTRR